MVGSAQSLSRINFGGNPLSGIGRDPSQPPFQFGNPPTNLNFSSFPYQNSGAGSGISPLIFILPILFMALPLLLSGLQSLFSSGKNKNADQNNSCNNNQITNNANGCQKCGQQKPNLNIDFNNNDCSGGRDQ